MGTISKNFSYSEFEKTDVPNMQVKNTITSVEVRDNIKSLVDEVIQPLRDTWGKPLAINSGYRCEEVNKAAKGEPTSQHCFDTMTEILTNNGWKTNESISLEDKVFSYNFDTARIELKPINEIIRRTFVGDLFRVSNKHLDIVCTDEHNIIIRYDNLKYKRRGNNIISQRGQAYFDSLKTNNDKWHLEKMLDVFGKRRQFMTCGYSIEKNEYDRGFMKFIMAVVADGYFGWHCGQTPYIGFHVKKERKITYLQNLMDDLGIRYSLRKDKDDTYYFYIGKIVAEKALVIIGKEKNLPSYILKADSDTLRELVNTYVFFDGHADKRPNNIGLSISSVNEHNASILQAMCVLAGMRCVMASREGTCSIIRGKQVKNTKRIYMLSICPDLISSKSHEDNYEKIGYNGEVWCVRDDNDSVIIRRNGKVSIQGNCKGEAGDVCPFGRNGHGDVKVVTELASLVKKMGLPFDQMGLYGSFVHLSHKREGKQRGQIFYDKSYTGEKI